MVSLLTIAIIQHPKNMKRLPLKIILFLWLAIGTTQLFAQTAHDHPDHELIFKNLKGDTIALSELKGKVVFLNIWAVWCGPCVQEMPGLNHLYTLYKNNPEVVFLFVDADSNLKKAERFMKRKRFELPVYESVNGLPRSMFRDVLPTTMVFDKSGKVIMFYEGAADYSNENFIRKFDEYLKQN